MSDILEYAQLLRQQSSRELTSDRDILDAFVLHKKSAILQLLTKRFSIFPELLLSGAFQENGELNVERFSLSAKALFAYMLQRARHTGLVSSESMLDALVDFKAHLAGKALQELDRDPSRFIQSAFKLKICTTKVRRVLYLAELFARADETKVGEEHLSKAYLQCIVATD